MTAIKTTLNESPGSARPTTPTDNLPRSNTDDALRYLAEQLSALVIGVDVQAWDADLDAIAALVTTTYGRSLLTLADATALAAQVDSFFLTPAEGNAAYQPLDSDLTAIAALATTSFGRSFLVYADEVAFKAGVNLEIGVDVQAFDADLAALAANSTNGLWARTGAGTGAARTLTGPAAGITVSNGSGAAGNPTLALANDLAALEALGSTGIAARTGTDAWAQRTITGPAAGITVSNGSGAAGNPTLALADDLAALEGMSGTGLVARTASNTYAQRTLTAPAAGITVSNGDGVSGNPTLVLANDLAAVEGLAATGLVRRTGSDTWSAGTTVATTEITDDAVTYAKMQNISATSRILGRKTSGAGDTEECTLSEVLDFIGSAAQGDILYRGASAWSRLGAGTSGQVLTTLGTGQNPLWRMPYIRSVLGATTATGVATLDLTIPTDCDIMEIEMLNIVPATDNVNLHCRFSQGGSFLSGGSDYNWAMLRVRDASVTGNSDDLDVAMNIVNGLDNVVGSRFNIRIYRPSAAGVRKHMNSFGTHMNLSAQVQVASSVGRLEANTDAIDGVRFLFSAGNIANCDYAVNAIKLL